MMKKDPHAYFWDASFPDGGSHRVLEPPQASEPSPLLQFISLLRLDTTHDCYLSCDELYHLHSDSMDALQIPDPASLYDFLAQSADGCRNFGIHIGPRPWLILGSPDREDAPWLGDTMTPRCACDTHPVSLVRISRNRDCTPLLEALDLEHRPAGSLSCAFLYQTCPQLMQSFRVYNGDDLYSLLVFLFRKPEHPPTRVRFGDAPWLILLPSEAPATESAPEEEPSPPAIQLPAALGRGVPAYIKIQALELRPSRSRSWGLLDRTLALDLLPDQLLSCQDLMQAHEGLMRRLHIRDSLHLYTILVCIYESRRGSRVHFARSPWLVIRDPDGVYPTSWPGF